MNILLNRYRLKPLSIVVLLYVWIVLNVLIRLYIHIFPESDDNVIRIKARIMCNLMT